MAYTKIKEYSNEFIGENTGKAHSGKRSGL